MGNELHRGNVEVLPYDGACDYCDYKDVCLRSEDDKIREKTVSGKTDVFQFFEKAGAEDGGDKVD